LTGLYPAVAEAGFRSVQTVRPTNLGFPHSEKFVLLLDIFSCITAYGNDVTVQSKRTETMIP